MTTNEFIDVTVKVERSRVEEFYEWFGRWSRAAKNGGIVQQAGSAPLDWGSEPHDGELAASVWDRLTKRAQTMFSIFLDNPTARHTGEALAEMADIPNGRYGVAGTLAWPGRFCLAVQRKLPLEFKDDGDGHTYYWMRPETADLFRRARERAQARAR